MVRQLGPKILGCFATIAALGLLSFPPVAPGDDDQDGEAHWDNERLHSPLWQCVVERDQVRDDLDVCNVSLATCKEELEACSMEEQGNMALVAATGQTVCFGDPGTGSEEIECSTFDAEGQDGQVRAGIVGPSPRFTDNEDGTVLDALTGLLWLKNWSCSGSVDWVGALQFTDSLESGICGLADSSQPGDWRLPNRNELLSVVDVTRSFPAISPAFEEVGSAAYWSSTTYIAHALQAWGIDFTTGRTIEPLKPFAQARATAVRNNE